MLTLINSPFFSPHYGNYYPRRQLVELLYCLSPLKAAGLRDAALNESVVLPLTGQPVS